MRRKTKAMRVAETAHFEALQNQHHYRVFSVGAVRGAKYSAMLVGLGTPKQTTIDVVLATLAVPIESALGRRIEAMYRDHDAAKKRTMTNAARRRARKQKARRS